MKKNKTDSVLAKEGGAKIMWAKRVLNTLLSTVLVVGLMPSMSWADDVKAADGASSPESIVATVDAEPEVSTEVASEALIVAETEVAPLVANSAVEPMDVSGDTVTIGTGTGSSHYGPYYNYYKNSGVQMIYTASEIESAGTINAIAFYCSTVDSNACSVFKVYMGHTSKTAFSSTSDYVAASDLTLVYDNSSYVLGSATGWETIELQTPFEYDGTDNLVIAVYRQASNCSNAKYYYTSTENSVLYRGNDTSNGCGIVDNTSNYTKGSYRPNLQLTIETCDHTAKTFHAAVPHTCTTDGNVAYSSCDSCGKYFDADGNKLNSIVDPAAHVYGEGTQTIAPTCGETGIMTYTCSVCDAATEGHVKTEVIPATKAHNFVDGVCTNLLRDGSTVCGALDQWDGTTLTEPAQVDGVYQITEGAELAWFMKEATASAYAGNAILTRNINMGTLASWYTVGGSSGANGYQGTFDGNGKSITMNLTCTSGPATLFKCIGTNGVVKNLTLNGSFASNLSSTGYAVAAMTYCNYGTITNCVNNAAMSATSTSATAYAAGFAGYQNYGAINHCVNHGNITSATTSTYGSAYAAGIAGYMSSNAAGVNGYNVTVEYCYNDGAINASTTGTNSNCYARSGGIIGYHSYNSNGYFYVNNCLNAGAVQTGKQIGGIIAAVAYSPSYVGNQVYKDCFYVEGTAEQLYNSTSTSADAITMTNCGSASSSNVGDAMWVEENLGAWFIDVLGLTPTPTYNITFAVSHATVKVDGEAVTSASVKGGKTQSFTVEADEGYGIDSVTFGSEVLTAVDGVYTTPLVTAATTVTVATHEHVWNDGVVTTNATCGTDGQRDYACTVGTCSAVKNEVIPATGKHDIKAVAKVEPTCTEPGAEAHYKCSTCEKLFSDAEGTTGISAPVAILATGHNYTGAVTSNNNGTHSVSCVNGCGTPQIVDCTMEDTTVATEAGCTTEGAMNTECSICSYKSTRVIPAAGHTYVNGVCSVCSAYEPLTIGTGTSQNAYPYVSNYKNSIVSIIYSADEMGKSGAISSIAFDQTTTGYAHQTTRCEIWLGHVSASQISETDASTWRAEDLTQVYSGTPNMGASVGWETYEFNMNEGSFNYDKDRGNLVVVFIQDSASYSSNGPKYYASSVAGTVGYMNSDSKNFTKDSDITKVAGYRPNIRMDFVPEAACDHQLQQVAAVPATCTAPGTQAYFQCKTCDKMFADAEATTRIFAPVEIPQLDHSYKYADKNDGTHVKTCATCDTVQEVEACDFTSNPIYQPGPDGYYYCLCGSKASKSVVEHPVLTVANELVSGKQYVIAYDGHALTAGAPSSGHMAATTIDVTTTNPEDIAEALIWTFDGSHLTIKPTSGNTNNYTYYLCNTTYNQYLMYASTISGYLASTWAMTDGVLQNTNTSIKYPFIAYYDSTSNFYGSAVASDEENGIHKVTVYEVGEGSVATYTHVPKVAAPVTVNGVTITAQDIERYATDVTLQKKGVDTEIHGAKLSDLLETKGVTMPVTYHLSFSAADKTTGEQVAYTKWYPSDSDIDGIYLFVDSDYKICTAADQAVGGYKWISDFSAITIDDHTYVDGACAYCGVAEPPAPVYDCKAYIRLLFSKLLCTDPPSASEEARWANLLKERGADYVIKQLIALPAWSEADLSNEEIVARLYHSVMEKDEPTEQNVSYWTKFLSSGNSVEAMVDKFATSSNFKAVGNKYGIYTEAVENATVDKYTGSAWVVRFFPTAEYEEGTAPTFDGQDMVWLEPERCWAVVVFERVGTVTAANMDMNEAATQVARASRTGDVSGNGVVDIVDAQIAYDLASKDASALTAAVTQRMWLEADVNGDGAVDAADARAIQYLCHKG